MNIVLLSGGSGKRLWPLSNEIRSKQFIKLIKSSTGEYESMVQRVYRQIKTADPSAVVTIATSKSQVSAIRNHLDSSVGISIEPCRRDTFPAIALACAYLHDVQGVDVTEPVVICPVDPYVDQEYFDTVLELSSVVESGACNIALMGVAPTYPSEKYGYIIPNFAAKVSSVLCFKEKPTAKVAASYIAQGALWNGGVFALRLDYILAKTEEMLGSSDYKWLYEHYADLPKISFDYAVVEKEPSISVVRYSGEWKDLGTWNTLTEAMGSPVVGQAILDADCRNVHVVNELDVPIVCSGVSDLVVSASPEGILVCEQEHTAHIKPLVDQIEQEVHFAEKSWGKYEVLDISKFSKTIKVTVKAGCHMAYHCHENRDENWTVISGRGRAVVDSEVQNIGPGDVVSMPAGVPHTVLANTELCMIEVQMGSEISASDKVKLELSKDDLISKTAKDEYRRWRIRADESLAHELDLIENNAAEIEAAFGSHLHFGTGGLRDIMGPGPSRLNIHTVARATQGLADYICAKHQEGDRSVAIGYDTRHLSDSFALMTASVLAGNGIQVFLFDKPLPTPMLSYAVRKLGCSAGVVITASHNSKEYNGYKVYDASGCQVTDSVAHDILQQIENHDVFDGISSMDFEKGRASGLIHWIPQSLFNSYVEETLAESVGYTSALDKSLSVVYSPLHGTGTLPVLKTLSSAGYGEVYPVLEQASTDGTFVTCPEPNPEHAPAMQMALKLAERKNADLVMATDPDCDRVAVGVRDAKGGYVLLSGNETGILLEDYILSQRKKYGTLPESPMILKTIVSTDLGSTIAKSYGCSVRSTLTGFKYIGEQVSCLERQGREENFVFGFEESCGYLTGTHVRDKDGVLACLHIADMAALYKAQGMTLLDRLEQLYEEHGYTASAQKSFAFKGVNGKEEMASYMNQLRSEKTPIDGFKVIEVEDFSKGLYGLPKSNVLKFSLEGDHSVIVRPSGTEPKLKIYISATGSSRTHATDIQHQIAEKLQI